MTTENIYQASKDYIAHYSTGKEITNLLSKTVVSSIFARLLGGSFIAKAGIFLILHVFDVDFSSLLEGMVEDVKSLAKSSGNNLHPDDVQKIVDTHVDTAFSETSSEQAAQNAAKLIKDTSKASDQSISSASQEMDMLKLSFIKYYQSSGNVKIAAGSSAMATLAKGKEVVKKGLKGTIGGIFKVLLGGMGLTLFSDFVKGFVLDLPTPLDKVFDFGPRFYPKVSTQTKFPLNPSYTRDPSEFSPITVAGVSNDYANIKKMLLDWTNEIYSGVPASALDASTEVPKLINKIIEINDVRTVTGNIIMPYQFTNKKQIVDWFIDDVAAKAEPLASKAQYRKQLFQQIIKQN